MGGIPGEHNFSLDVEKHRVESVLGMVLVGEVCIGKISAWICKRYIP